MHESFLWCNLESRLYSCMEGPERRSLQGDGFSVCLRCSNNVRVKDRSRLTVTNLSKRRGDDKKPSKVACFFCRATMNWVINEPLYLCALKKLVNIIEFRKLRQGLGFMSYTASAAGVENTAEVEWWGHETSEQGGGGDKWPRRQAHSVISAAMLSLLFTSKTTGGVKGAGRNNDATPGREEMREQKRSKGW